MIGTDRFPLIEAPDAGTLWRWLEANHAQEGAVWLVTWLKRPGAPHLSREAVLDMLIAWGWIDGLRRAHGYGGAETPGKGRMMQLISPRRPSARAERLLAEGRMAAPGILAMQAAQSAGSWEADPEVDALVVPEDLTMALGTALQVWESFPPSHRRNVLRWIAGARTAPTRAKRIGVVVELARQGKRVPQF